MVIATMSIAVEAGIAKIYAVAPEIDYFCYQLSPDSFSFHSIKKMFSFPLFSFIRSSFFLKSIQPFVIYVNTHHPWVVVLDFLCICNYYVFSIDRTSSHTSLPKDEYLLYERAEYIKQWVNLTIFTCLLFPAGLCSAWE